MRLAAAAIAGLLLVGGAASAQTISRLGLGLVIGGSPGALDAIVSAPAAAAYSFRKLRAAYGGSAVQLRRTDLATQDIGFTGSGDFDTASATTFCNATSCFVAKWYDQSGLALDAVQATAANQPPFILNCNGALPCMRATALIHKVASAPGQIPVLPVSFSAAANRGVGTGSCYWPLQFNANNSLSSTTANNWLLFATAGLLGSAPDAAWHAAAGVVNGASSVLRVDAAETTGTLTGGTAAGALVVFQGQDTTTCSIVEEIVWNSYALTPTERTALTANQRAYWGF